MKKILLVSLALLGGCTDVPPGYVGVLVHKLGGNKGVDSEEVHPGRMLLGWNDEIFLFPTFSQTQVWTQDKNEGSINDDSFTFQTNEGMSVNTDIGITYAIDPTKVTKVFTKYRKGIGEITNVYLRSMVRDALVKEAGILPIENVYGSGKSALLDAVKGRVMTETAQLGIIVENIYWIGSMRLPGSIVTSINAKAAATQLTAQREQEIQQAKAEADKKIQEARGDAESILLRANAEAGAIRIKGEAIAQNPRVLELTAIERWSGILPTTMVPNSSVPFITIK
jgi:regulator of protease activity HflC (stomatin/prohibitin superfamily)